MNNVAPPIIALVLAIALLGMVTRLLVPVARAQWARQTREVQARLEQIASLPAVAATHRRHACGRVRGHR